MNIRKYLPFVGLALLTITLMIYFRFNKQQIGSLIEKGKNNLADFYTANLKPLIFKTDITNEDVFNFALYQNVPIDKKKNEILRITDDPSGGMKYEIRPAIWKDNTNNYEKFVEYLDPSGDELEELDSIMNSYKDHLYKAILFNKNETIAVNPKISILRDGIVEDLIEFAKEISETKSTQIIPPDFKKHKFTAVNQIVQDIYEEEECEYIFFTPDTVFRTKCQFDKENGKKKSPGGKGDLVMIDDELRNLKIRVALDKGNMKLAIDSLDKNSFHFKIDSTVSLAFLPESFIKKFPIPDIEVLQERIDSATGEAGKFSFKLDLDSLENDIRFRVNTFESADPASVMDFEFNLKNIDSIIEQSIKVIELQKVHDWEKFGLRMDSLASSLEIILSDSSLKLHNKHFPPDRNE